ncbi:PREDICTED: calcipressin-1-like [Priapulus caudatus]|uniref:Calcipressin-1-like n=1 Tax=Priapulus caudatus TaxID=37621 RepID=A0ABM1EWZ4_PRICU|nr:PREDICTED: calcipressin-1-like [Priapulus caudatus]
MDKATPKISSMAKEMNLDLEELHINEGKELITYDPEDTPCTLIVTGLALEVFEDPDNKKDFEAIFKEFDEQAVFCYLRSFRRARVNFSNSETTKKARVQTHEVEVCGKNVKVYFGQPVFSLGNQQGGHSHLEPPPLEKQFLISPPTSPPAGWAQFHEARPKIDMDLITALVNLVPGEMYEVLAAHNNQPGITVEVVEDIALGPKPTIVHTKRPDNI